MLTKVETRELAIIGRTQALGDEDVLNGGHHLTTAQCLSQKAKVLTVERDEFLRLLNSQNNPDSLAEQVTNKIKRYALCYKAKSKAKEDIDVKGRIVLKKSRVLPMADAQKSCKQTEDKKESSGFRQSLD